MLVSLDFIHLIVGSLRNLLDIYNLSWYYVAGKTLLDAGRKHKVRIFAVSLMSGLFLLQYQITGIIGQSLQNFQILLHLVFQMALFLTRP